MAIRSHSVAAMIHYSRTRRPLKIHPLTSWILKRNSIKKEASRESVEEVLKILLDEFGEIFTDQVSPPRPP